MSTLLERFRDSKRFDVTVDGATFKGRRASLEEIQVNASMSNAEACRRCIDGWEGVKESDIVPDGSGDLVDFDKELFDEVIAFKVDWCTEIVKSILLEATEHNERKEANAKKSKRGSKASS